MKEEIIKENTSHTDVLYQVTPATPSGNTSCRSDIDTDTSPGNEPVALPVFPGLWLK